MSRNLLLVSSSKCHPHGYLDHCAEQMEGLFDGVDEIVFVPYARPGGTSHDEYTSIARERFAKLNISVRGLHEFQDAHAAVADAKGVFIGGGNTFVLLRQLYADGVVELMGQRMADGMPYMGTSAGSNVAGLSIGTSNDMPIVHPPSFDAFQAVPFNINPHFPRTAPDPTHMGETRDDRIKEFHFFNDQPVLAICEDSMLRIEGSQMTLTGELDAYLFRKNAPRQTFTGGSDLSELLE
ncbi:MAG: dipeptidase PepE [Planctomycetaceae bacterium]